MGIRVHTLCISLALCGLSSLAHAQQVMWDGDAGDGFWMTPSNWDTDQIPGLSAQVSIPGDAGLVTIELALATVGSVDCQSGLRLNAGSLDVMGTSNVMNLQVEGTFNPTIFTDSAFTVSGSSSAASLSIEGLGSFSNAGTFNAFGVGVQGTTINNSGTWNLAPSSGYISLNNNASMSNTGTITMLNACAIDGTGTLTNTGTIRRTGGAGFADITSGYTQTAGSLIADGSGANLNLASGGWTISGGTISVLNNAVINLAGSNAGSVRSIGASSITGTGSVGIFPANTTLNWPGTTSVNVAGSGVELWAGTINLTGSILNSGSMDLRGVIISGSGSLNNTASGHPPCPIWKRGRSASEHDQLRDNRYPRNTLHQRQRDTQQLGQLSANPPPRGQPHLHTNRDDARHTR